MKSLNKKISVVVLAGSVLIGSGLSQGFVAYANYDLLNHRLLKDYDKMDQKEIFDCKDVENNQKMHMYDALYLGNSKEYIIEKIEKTTDGKHTRITPKPDLPKHFYLNHRQKYFYLEFKDGNDFLDNISKLNPYRYLDEPIVIKVGNSYFNIFFNLTEHQSRVIPIKELAKQYGFSVAYADSNYFYGIYVTQSHLETRDDLKNRPDIIEKLIKEPSENGKDLFENPEAFAFALKSGKINIPNGFSRYRIGDYDYIFEK